MSADSAVVFTMSVGPGVVASIVNTGSAIVPMTVSSAAGVFFAMRTGSAGVFMQLILALQLFLTSHCSLSVI